MDSVMLSRHYGRLRAYTPYKIIAEGRDWYQVKAQGKSMYVPKIFEHFGPIPTQRFTEEEEDEYGN